MPDVSIVIVNWNTLELTTETVRSVIEHTKDVAYELILVDNGSARDDSAQELPRRFPDAVFVRSPENLGFAGANNLGFQHARGRYILLLNSDTLQVENAIGKSVAYMDQHPDVGALGIQHLNADGELSVQPSAFPAPNPAFDIGVVLGFDAARHGMVDLKGASEEGDVDWVVGSYLLIRRECLAQVGPLDDRFFLYDEDIDWCHRARRAGWRVRFYPGTRLIHLGNGSRGHMRDKTFLHFRSRLTYIAKAHAFPVAAAYYLALGLRLTAATLWQASKVLVGRGRAADLKERFDRQRRFLSLTSGRAGS